MSIKSLFRADHDWPLLLDQLPQKDQPSQLYYEGILPKKDELCVAIVGSRHPTKSGIMAAQLFAAALAHKNVTVVSGLALGIDGAAHQATLDARGRTIAIVGSGLDRSVLYPKRHHLLAENILKRNGCLLSEYAPSTAPAPWTFPKRNRIIAGLSVATIVIEATEKSGALITSRCATEYNRDVGAVPGNIFSDLSAGPNMLISKGAAVLRNVDDLYTFLNITPKTSIKSAATEDDALLQYFDGEHTVEDILILSGLTREDLLGRISELEIHGNIRNMGGTIYQKTNT